MKDFTKSRSTKPLEFKIDGDTFQAVPQLNAEQQIQAVSLMNRIGVAQLDGLALENIDGSSATMTDVERAREIATSANDAVFAMVSMLDELLLPDSAARFAERMKSKTEPIDLEQVTGVFEWLISTYGERPTTPLSSSSNGHSGTGTPSMVDTQVVG
jgi:hypothetical protein